MANLARHPGGLQAEPLFHRQLEISRPRSRSSVESGFLTTGIPLNDILLSLQQGDLVTINPISRLFGRSPFKAMQEHMRIVEECVEECVPFFEALRKGDREAMEVSKIRVFELENQADEVKHKLRSQLPKSLFMPVDRRDILDLLSAQDSIADTAQDIAGLLALREMPIPAAFEDLLLTYVKRNLDATQQCRKIIDELDELLELGFRGREVERVLGMIEVLGQIETDTDAQEIELTRRLFGLEDELKPLTLVLWYELIHLIGDIADYAEDVGDRLRLLIAH